ncbi:hypothetical protein N7449_003650 [Penicillium cf. viridicatum]|uniref:FAD-binding domain-containing protein n=1 Tax=Penicillium cf. viridicatum TaxID=2972119 RepID=A0A9W9T4R8_9EURO|nr:hypothetical protein N7449_003650 [Penicillium cf. viridicatum]
MEGPKGVEAGIKIAIIGGGPAGLSAAIELAKLPFVEWTLYEQKPSIREIGTGISLQRNTWRLLEKLGVSGHLKVGDFFRPKDGHDTQYRDGRTGVVVKQTYPLPSVAPQQAPCRIHRGRLQRALLKNVDQSRVRPGKKLVEVERVNSGRLRLTFSCGSVDEVDLIIGADGIRSVSEELLNKARYYNGADTRIHQTIRTFAFPEYSVSYACMAAYRAVVREADVRQINGLSKAIIFWYGTKGQPDENDRTSWDKEVNVAKFIESFHEYCESIQQLLSLVTQVKRFDYFSGPDRDQSRFHRSNW